MVTIDTMPAVVSINQAPSIFGKGVRFTKNGIWEFFMVRLRNAGFVVKPVMQLSQEWGEWDMRGVPIDRVFLGPQRKSPNTVLHYREVWGWCGMLQLETPINSESAEWELIQSIWREL